MEALLKELVDRIQRLEENELLKKLDARLCRLEVQLQEQTVMLQKTLPSPNLEVKLSELKEGLKVQTDQITEQLETKLRRLERQLLDRNNLVKWELLAELMIIEQNQPLPQASRTVTQGTQTTETPRGTTADAEVQVEDPPGTVKDVGVQVHLLPKEEEKRWDVCVERMGIHRGVCRRERAVLVGEDGIVEFCSSGKVVGRYLELKGRRIYRMFCSEEYIGVMLSNYSVACYKWFSDRLEWLYCLYVEGQTWRKVEVTSEVPSELEQYYYSQARNMVCCSSCGQVSGWSLSQDRTIFNIKVPGAKYLYMTPDLVLVDVNGGRIEVFSLEGSNLYSIQGAVAYMRANPLNNTNFTALVSYQFTITWPSFIGQPVTKIAAFHSALHPHLPLLCSSIRGELWELVLRDRYTNSVIWRRHQSGFNIQVFSIDSEFLLIKPYKAPVQILRWSSGEVVATLPVAGDYIQSASPQYIISDEQVLYRDLT